MMRRMLDLGLVNKKGAIMPAEVSRFFESAGVTFCSSECSQFWPASPEAKRVAQRTSKLPEMFDALGIPRYELAELTDNQLTLLRCLDVLKGDPLAERDFISFVTHRIRLRIKAMGNDPESLRLDGRRLPASSYVLPERPKKVKKERKKRGRKM